MKTEQEQLEAYREQLEKEKFLEKLAYEEWVKEESEQTAKGETK